MKSVLKTCFIVLHADVAPETVTTALRLVIKYGVISEEKVIVTPDNSLGIWHLNGLPLADLLETIRSRPRQSPHSVLIEALGHQKGKTVADWMEGQGCFNGKS